MFQGVWRRHPCSPPEDPYPLGVVLCGHQPDTLQPPSSVCLFHLCVLSTQDLLSGVLGEAGALGTRSVHCVCVLSAGATRTSLHGSRSPVVNHTDVRICCAF